MKRNIPEITSRVQLNNPLMKRWQMWVLDSVSLVLRVQERDTVEGGYWTSDILRREKWKWSCSVVSDSLRPHGLQHTRIPHPSSTPGAYSNSCPLSLWCHPTISTSLVPFSSCLQSFPASGPFPMSQFFTSGGQNTQNDRIRNYPKTWPTSFFCFISMALLIDGHSYFAWIPPDTGNPLFWRRLLFFFFAAPDGLWHLSFPTSHGIWDPCKWELESQPLDNQEIPREFIISLFLNLCLLAWIKKKKGKKTHKIF